MNEFSVYNLVVAFNKFQEARLQQNEKLIVDRAAILSSAQKAAGVEMFSDKYLDTIVERALLGDMSYTNPRQKSQDRVAATEKQDAKTFRQLEEPTVRHATPRNSSKRGQKASEHHLARRASEAELSRNDTVEDVYRITQQMYRPRGKQNARLAAMLKEALALRGK